MKKTSVVLVFDIGTQSTRALLVSPEGNTGKSPGGHHRLMFQKKNPDGQNRILILLPESVPCFQTASGELSGYFCSDPGSNAYNDPLYQCLPWTGRRTFAPCNFMAGSEKSFRYACAEALDFCSGKSSGNDKNLKSPIPEISL